MASKKHKSSKKGASTGKKSTVTTQKTAIHPTKRASTSSLWLIGLLLMIITGIVYRGALDNDFVDWDDYKYVIYNDLVRSSSDIQTTTSLRGNQRVVSRSTSPLQTTLSDVFTTSVALNYHPLTVLTLRWNNNADPTNIEGISARPFILWNIILHLLNSFLVLLLIYRLSKKNLWASAFVALVFALHPMHVESVAWVSERKDVLYSFFFLLGLLSYWEYLTSELKKWFWWAFVFFILSCLSKAMAVVFPLVLLLLHFWEAKEKSKSALSTILSSSTWLPLWPFFLSALFFGLLAINIQAGGDFFGLIKRGTKSVAIANMDTFNLWDRIQFAGHGFMQYLFKFFWPSNLSPYYPYPAKENFASSWYSFAPILMVTILASALISIKKTKALFMGIGFYFVTIVLVLQFVSVGSVIMAERYSYLPYIGLSMAIAFLVQQYIPKEKQHFAFSGLIGLGLLLSIPTIQQIEVWQDSEKLWTTAIEQQTKNGQALLSNMSAPFSIRGSCYGKRAQGSKSVAERQKYLDKAFQDFIKAAELGSKDASVYKGLGNTFGMRGNSNRDQARRLQQQGKTAEAQAMQQQSNKDLQKAIKYHTKVITLIPNQSAESYFNRGITYSILRNHEKAIADYTAFINSQPEHISSVYLNRGISYFELQQYPAAKADFEKALRHNPQDELAKNYLNKLH